MDKLDASSNSRGVSPTGVSPPASFFPKKESTPDGIAKKVLRIDSSAETALKKPLGKGSSFPIENRTNTSKKVNEVALESVSAKKGSKKAASISQPMPKSLPEMSIDEKGVTFHEDGGFAYVDEYERPQRVSASWMNGDKATRKAALAVIFQNEPGSTKLVSDFLSKLGQPMAGGKVGVKVKLLDKALESYYDKKQEKILWKVADIDLPAIDLTSTTSPSLSTDISLENSSGSARPLVEIKPIADFLKESFPVVDKVDTPEEIESKLVAPSGKIHKVPSRTALKIIADDVINIIEAVRCFFLGARAPVKIKEGPAAGESAEAKCPTITQEFPFKNGVVFKDECKFQGTVDSYKRSLVAKQTLEKEKEPEKSDVDLVNKKWVDCNHYRNQAKSFAGYKEFIATIKPILPNLIVETVTKKEGDEVTATQVIARSGALTDQRNGHFSLSDLHKMKEEIVTDPYKKYEDTLICKIKERIEATKTKAKKGSFGRKKELSSKQQESIDDVKNKLKEVDWLVIDPAADNKIRDRKNPLYVAHYNKAIDKLIKEREDFCIPQFLQLLEAEFGSSSRGENGKFLMVQTSLLHGTKPKFEKSGFRKDEQVQIEDMDRIFEKFDGYKIAFKPELDGSHVDQDAKTIYLPWSMKPQNFDEKKPIALRTAFFNISIQTDMSYKDKNTDESTDSFKSINQKNMKRLNTFAKEDCQESFSPILKPAEKSGYTDAAIAQNLIATIKERFGSACGVGVNCFSGKDRTGFILSRLTQWFIGKSVGEENNVYKRTLLHSDSMATTVVNINTGARYIKLDPIATGDTRLGVSQLVRGTRGVLADKVQGLWNKLFGNKKL